MRRGRGSSVGHGPSTASCSVGGAGTGVGVGRCTALYKLKIGATGVRADAGEKLKKLKETPSTVRKKRSNNSGNTPYTR